MKIGVLGAGQLGRMLALNGYQLNHQFAFTAKSNNDPSSLLGTVFTESSGQNTAESLINFADVITFESENTDIEIIRNISSSVQVFPGEKSLFTAQHRGREKSLFNKLNIPCAPNQIVNSLSDLKLAVNKIGLPAILKTTTDGYDGKGQFVINRDDQINDAWNNMGGVESILEGFVTFKRELSLIAVRGTDNDHRYYPLVENTHHNGILRMTNAPAENISNEIQETAEHYMKSLLDDLNHVGVLTIELFETEDGLVANEIAPRVHNSGHWSIEGARTSQFENHIRAITAMPLGDTATLHPFCTMINIIGKVGDVNEVLSMPNVHLHLYDKEEREDRKLGHITITAKSRDELNNNIEQLKQYLPK